MVTTAPSSILSVLLPLAIVLPIIFFRVRRIRNGTRVSAGRTVAFSTILLGISIALTVNSFYLGVSSTYGFVYAAIFLIVAYASYHYSNRVLDFWRTRDGSIYVKGGTAVFLFYIVSMVARLAVSSIVGGSQGFFISPQNQAVPAEVIVAAAIFDGLLMAGVASLIGRNARILKNYHRIKDGKDNVRQVE